MNPWLRPLFSPESILPTKSPGSTFLRPTPDSSPKVLYGPRQNLSALNLRLKQWSSSQCADFALVRQNRHRCTVLFQNRRDPLYMLMAILGRGQTILLFEQFDKMRRIGKIALQTNLRHRLVRRNQQQPRMHQTLTNKPFMWRLVKMSTKFLLERSETPMTFLRQILHRNILENMLHDDLFKVLLRQIRIPQNLIFETGTRLR